MRVIITGGTGLVGSALASSLAGDGHDVIVLSRNPERVAKQLQKGIRAERWDARTPAGWGELVNGTQVIVNLAGEVIGSENVIAGRWTEKRKHAMLQSRLDAGRAVVEAVRAAHQKPSLVLQASASGFYGERGDEILTEEAGPGRDFLAQVCVQSEASTEPVEALGVRRVVTRTGLLLNTKRGAFVPLRFLTSIGAGGPIGSGRQYWPWIHMDDEIAAMRFLIDSGASGVVNLCAPQSVRQIEFARTLGRVMKRPSIMPGPAFAVRMVVGEMADYLLLMSQRLVPECLQLMGFPFKFPELEPALRDLLQ
jgi:uncharacterized protein (TIGR01777 family)